MITHLSNFFSHPAMVAIIAGFSASFFSLLIKSIIINKTIKAEKEKYKAEIDTQFKLAVIDRRIKAHQEA